MLRRCILFVFAILLAYPAWANEAAKKEGKADPGTTIKLPFLVVPMSQEGTLIGHTYVASKISCTSAPACIKISEKMAFIQDAFVREVYSRPVSLPDNPKELDKAQLSLRLTAAARRTVGADKVSGIEIIEAKFAPLHPSDSTPMAPEAEQANSAPADGSGETGKSGHGETKGGAEAAKSGQSKGATSKPGASASH